MPVIATLEQLPTSGLTITALQALDTVVPGEWSNTTSFDALIAEVEPNASPALIAKIREHAMRLQADPRYDRAIQAYTLVDTVDQLAAGAAVASKVTDLFGSLGFLKKFTPKPETTQSVDAGLKLVAELIAFGLLNGIPSTSPDGLAKFIVALSDYGRYDLMRIASWVAFDGLIPLGPNFVSKIVGTLKSAASSDLAGNAAFEQLAGQLPGNSAAEKQAFIAEAVESAGEWVNGFVAEKGLTQEKLLSQLQGTMSITEGGLDYVAAAIDASTAYFSHTGTQTVARTLARHSVAALKDDVWKQYVASL